MTKFEKKCLKVSEKTGVSFYSPYEDDNMHLDAFEDDGCLHIHKGGIRACFGVNPTQDEPAKIQNERTREVLKALGLEKLIGSRVLVDETEEDQECPHCGRPL